MNIITEIHISDEPLDEDFCKEFVKGPESGGIVIFIGTVRHQTQGKTVVRLEFESKVSMALKEMQKIIDKARYKWPIEKMLIHHRVGSLAIGDTAVVIAVSAAHRKAAYEASQFAIDTLKQTVPIWKKELFTDGEVWVAAHP